MGESRKRNANYVTCGRRMIMTAGQKPINIRISLVDSTRKTGKKQQCASRGRTEKTALTCFGCIVAAHAIDVLQRFSAMSEGESQQSGKRSGFCGTSTNTTATEMRESIKHALSKERDSKRPGGLGALDGRTLELGDTL